MYDSAIGYPAIGFPARPPLPSDDSWEARMAQRAAARRLIAEAERACEVDIRLAKAKALAVQAKEALGPVDWLHGWLNLGEDTVLIGTGLYCVYCGADWGVTTVAIDPDWVPPPTPDWPLKPEHCPVCVLRRLRYELC
jgi:hypothetical protein